MSRYFSTGKSFSMMVTMPKYRSTPLARPGCRATCIQSTNRQYSHHSVHVSVYVTHQNMTKEWGTVDGYMYTADKEKRKGEREWFALVYLQHSITQQYTPRNQAILSTLHCTTLCPSAHASSTNDISHPTFIPFLTLTPPPSLPTLPHTHRGCPLASASSALERRVLCRPRGYCLPSSASPPASNAERHSTSQPLQAKGPGSITIYGERVQSHLSISYLLAYTSTHESTAGSLHITAQHSTVQHTESQHTTAHYCTVHHSTAQHSTVQHSTLLHSTAHREPAHYCTLLHSTAQYITALHTTAQYCTVHHSTAQHSTSHSTSQHCTAQHSTVHHSTAQHSPLHLHSHGPSALGAL